MTDALAQQTISNEFAQNGKRLPSGVLKDEVFLTKGAGVAGMIHSADFDPVVNEFFGEVDDIFAKKGDYAVLMRPAVKTLEYIGIEAIKNGDAARLEQVKTRLIAHIGENSNGNVSSISQAVDSLSVMAVGLANKGNSQFAKDVVRTFEQELVARSDDFSHTTLNEMRDGLQKIMESPAGSDDSIFNKVDRLIGVVDEKLAVSSALSRVGINVRGNDWVSSVPHISLPRPSRDAIANGRLLGQDAHDQLDRLADVITDTTVHDTSPDLPEAVRAENRALNQALDEQQTQAIADMSYLYKQLIDNHDFAGADKVLSAYINFDTDGPGVEDVKIMIAQEILHLDEFMSEKPFPLYNSNVWKSFAGFYLEDNLDFVTNDAGESVPSRSASALLEMGEAMSVRMLNTSRNEYFEMPSLGQNARDVGAQTLIRVMDDFKGGLSNAKKIDISNHVDLGSGSAPGKVFEDQKPESEPAVKEPVVGAHEFTAIGG